MRTLLMILGLAAAIAGPLAAQQPDTTKKPVTRADSIRRRAVQDSLAKAVQDSIDLMRSLDSALATPSAQPNAGPQTGGATGPTNARLLPDISAVGDFIGDLSPKGSTQEDSTRFGVREVELAVQAVVDPYFRGDIFLGISDLEGIAIEQAFLTTTSIPDLEIRLGRYLMPFGKQNTTHRHDLHTIEYPYVIQRFFGPEGLKGTGVAANKVFAPFGFYQELQVNVIDRIGERDPSLHATESANRSLGGMGYSARLRNYVDLSQATNFELSFSALTGKREQPIDPVFAELLLINRGIDANAALARQTVLGSDLTFRWRPLQQGLYKSFILQAEVMRQINEKDPKIPGVGSVSSFYIGPIRNFTGGYVFARWQIAQRLFIGSRYDHVQDPEDNGRTFRAGSGYLEWFPSEFSKLVAAYERRDVPVDAGKNRILLQASFALGPHKPHPF